MRRVHLSGYVHLLAGIALASWLLIGTVLCETASASSDPSTNALPVQPFASIPSYSVPQQAAQGQAVFDQKCAGCHSIGGGRRAGPDLKGVTAQRPRDWLIRTITDPAGLIASGDPTAQQLVQEYGAPMPNLGVSQAEAESVLAYIEAQSGGAAQPAQPAAPLPQGNAAVGRALFAGGRQFASGGPACMACHNAEGLGALEGGTWGLDLTKSHTKFGADGLAGIIKSPPFPGMKEAYATAPVTDEEMADVVAFLAAIDQQQQEAGMSESLSFPLIGLAVFVLMIVAGQLLWRNRLRAVREPLVKRSTRRG